MAIPWPVCLESEGWRWGRLNVDVVNADSSVGVTHVVTQTSTRLFGCILTTPPTFRHIALLLFRIDTKIAIELALLL